MSDVIENLLYVGIGLILGYCIAMARNAKAEADSAIQEVRELYREFHLHYDSDKEHPHVDN